MSNELDKTQTDVAKFCSVILQIKERSIHVTWRVLRMM